MKRKQKVLIVITSIVFLVFLISLLWLINSYKAMSEVDPYLDSNESVEVFKDENGYYTFKPLNYSKAIIFYPGGKVDHLAYAPLLFELAEAGYLTILVEMPFNLAVFNINAANKVKSIYDNIEEWYLMGHSLGGSMAASHLSKNTVDYAGLILLGSYSTVDLNNHNLIILSIYGENDLIINMENYKNNLKNIKDVKELIVTGGNHANFGYYGNQKGDGVSSIDRNKQISETVNFITEYIK